MNLYIKKNNSHPQYITEKNIFMKTQEQNKNHLKQKLSSAVCTKAIDILKERETEKMKKIKLFPNFKKDS